MAAKKYLDEQGLQTLWSKLDDQNSKIVQKINSFSLDINEVKSKIQYDTKENWDNQQQLVAEKGVIYIYSNYQTDSQKNICGIKVGDGTSYLIDLPFTDTLYDKHIKNNEIHITETERTKWNNKVTIDDSLIQSETLVFTLN